MPTVWREIVSMNRRNFLFGAGASLAAATLDAPRLEAAAPLDRTNESTRWRTVRSQFDQLSPDYIHLSSFFIASHPRPVRDAIEKHRRSIDENPFVYLEEHMFEMPAKIQAAVAEYAGG